MFSKLFTMIFGGKAATTTTADSSSAVCCRSQYVLTPVAGEPAAEVVPPFQTEEFRTKFNAKKSASENNLEKIRDEIARLEEQKAALQPATTAVAELALRRLESLLKVRKEECSGELFQARDLRRNLLAEEKQDLLDQHLLLPAIQACEWKEEGESDYYTPKMVACWLAQRRIVRNEEGRYLLIEIRRRSANPYDWAKPFGPEQVAWVTDSVAQMNEAELEAIVLDQRARASN